MPARNHAPAAAVPAPPFPGLRGEVAAQPYDYAGRRKKADQPVNEIVGVEHETVVAGSSRMARMAWRFGATVTPIKWRMVS